MSFTQVTATGTVNLQTGGPAVGATVAAQLSGPITDGVTVIQPYIMSVITNSSGNFTLGPLPANDDSTTTPAGTYYIWGVGSSENYYEFFAVLPSADAPSVNLFSLTRLSSPTGVASLYVASIQGLNRSVMLSSPNSTVTIGTSGNTITLEAASGGVGNLDGGSASSVYAPGTGVDGGNASGD